MTEAAFQRLDFWLWCARIARSRADCAALVQQGGIRLNRQPTDKPHAKLRLGDVLTLPWRGEVVVVRVLAFAARRGSPAAALLLYDPILPDASPLPCTPVESSAYAADG